MADITNAAIGVNQHNYEINTKKPQIDVQCQNCENNKGQESDKILNSLDAMSAYNQGKINARPKTKEVSKVDAPYEFNSDKVTEDVKAFQENFDIAKGAASEYMQALIDNGYEAENAKEKAAQFAACLLTDKDV